MWGVVVCAVLHSLSNRSRRGTGAVSGVTLALPNAQDLGFRVDRVDKDNKMFIMIYLTKVKSSKPSLDAPPLKPCQYKRR